MRNVPQKGDHGYTDAHKKAQIIKTFIFFLLPAVIFTVGSVSYTHLDVYKRQAKISIERTHGMTKISS